MATRSAPTQADVKHHVSSEHEIIAKQSNVPPAKAAAGWEKAGSHAERWVLQTLPVPALLGGASGLCPGKMWLERCSEDGNLSALLA